MKWKSSLSKSNGIRKINRCMVINGCWFCSCITQTLTHQDNITTVTQKDRLTSVDTSIVIIIIIIIST